MGDLLVKRTCSELDTMKQTVVVGEDQKNPLLSQSGLHNFDLNWSQMELLTINIGWSHIPLWPLVPATILT